MTFYYVHKIGLKENYLAFELIITLCLLVTEQMYGINYGC